MGRAARQRKTRICHVCKKELGLTADEVKVHERICAFEQRTGLIVVHNDDRSLTITDRRDPHD